jgi:hypothetical protein
VGAGAAWAAADQQGTTARANVDREQGMGARAFMRVHFLSSKRKWFDARNLDYYDPIIPLYV